MKTYLSLIAIIIISSCSNKKQNDMKNNLDANSYNLGIIAGFAELVNCGVKKMALSDVLPPAEMDLIFDDAQKIAERNHVQIYRESDLLKTDLFPADVAVGKDVLLIYQGNIKDEYLALKKEAKKLEKEGKYSGEAKIQISRRFGRLLSYPPYRINELLAENTTFRTMKHFGIKASNIFLYYKNLDEATTFYTKTLGLELIADYSIAKILRITSQSYLILVDEEVGMHKTSEPKTMKLSLVTDQLTEWHTYLKEQKIKFKDESQSSEYSDNFSILDPAGYTIELISYKQNPANENLLAQTNYCKTIYGNNPKLGFKSSITWLYYKDMQNIEKFYDETIGLKQLTDWGYAKIYQVSSSGMVGLMNEKNGMPFTEKKAITVSFIIDSVDGWFNYCQKNIHFEMRSKEMEVGEGNKYKAFVGYDAEGYYLEFDTFYKHELNKKLMECLEK